MPAYEYPTPEELEAYRAAHPSLTVWECIAALTGEGTSPTSESSFILRNAETNQLFEYVAGPEGQLIRTAIAGLAMLLAMLPLSACAVEDVLVNSNGVLVSPTNTNNNFWIANSNSINAVVPTPTLPSWISTNAATSRTNLFGVGTNPLVLNEAQILQTASGATVTNIVLAATLDWWNNTTARDQTRTNLGLGATNTVTFGPAQVGSLRVDGTNPIGIGTNTRVALGVNGLQFFGDTADGARSGTRSEIGLGASWLINTNSPIYADTNGTVVTGRTNALIFSNSISVTNSSSLAITAPEGTLEGQTLSAYSTNAGGGSVLIAPAFGGTGGAAYAVLKWEEGSQQNPVIMLPTTSGTLLHGSGNLEGLSMPSFARTNLGLGYLGTNAATTLTNLFASNSLPSGAAATGVPLLADGASNSAFARMLPSLLAGAFVLSPATNVSSTTNIAVNVGGLSFAAEANTTYLFVASVELNIPASGGGYSLDATIPSSAAVAANGVIAVNSSTLVPAVAASTNSLRVHRATAAQSASGLVGTSFSILSARFTNSGTVQMTWSQATTGTNPSTITTNTRIYVLPLQ
jgi:hypothetical protein